MSRPRRDARAVDGIVLLDKPAGMTSNAALQRVKRHFRAAKAGHTGSLDPIATGLLPICLGQATRVSTYLLDADKRYRAVAQLGVRTETGDCEGEVIARSDHALLSAATLAQAATNFLGRQQQVPPMYSALKRQGVPLYKLARQGVEVAREPREIHIHDLRLLSCEADRFEFEVSCSKGTYIRTLAEDWAAAVGQCAHLVSLRRLELGGFGETGMVGLEAIEALQDFTALDALMLPLAAVFTDWPSVIADAASVFHLSHGQAVKLVGAPEHGRLVVFDDAGQLRGIAVIDAEGRVAPRRWFGSGNC